MVSAPSFWIGGYLVSRCVGLVYGADGAVRHHPHRSISKLFLLKICKGGFCTNKTCKCYIKWNESRDIFGEVRCTTMLNNNETT